MEDMKNKFLELAKKSEKLQDELNGIKTEMTVLMKELCISAVFQDMETLAVYKIIKPKGTYMYYKDIDYVRTALEGEGSGSLSKKEAESLGFNLRK